MGFGDFMSGLEKGGTFGMKVRSNKQREEANDILLRREHDIDKLARKRMGEKGFDPDDASLGTTPLYKMAGWLGDKLGIGGMGDYYKPEDVEVREQGAANAAEAAASTPDTASGTTTYYGDDEENQFGKTTYFGADGGNFRRSALPKRKKGRKSQRRQALPRFDGGELVGRRLTPEQAAEAERKYAERQAKVEAQRAADAAHREQVRAQAATNRGAPVEGPRSPTATGRAREALGRADEAAGKFLGRAPEGASWGRRALQGAKRLGALGVLADTNRRAWGTDTEDYRERFGLETDDPSFWGDVGVRTAGVASDLADSVGGMFGLDIGEHLYRDKIRQREVAEAEDDRVAQAEGKPPEVQAQQTEKRGEAAGQASISGAGGGGRATTGRSALEAATGAVRDEEARTMPDFDKVKFDKMKPGQVPNLTVKDWEQFRKDAVLDQLARRVPIGEAMNIADKQAVEIQQRGFVNFAQQAARLMAVNNLDGAMSALKAAYQMAPGGDDIKLAVHDGVIYGATFDEETGKPVGKPMPITPDRIMALVDQAQDPGAWREYAVDARNWKENMDRFWNVEAPYKQSAMDVNAYNAETNRMNANTSAYNADVRAQLAEYKARAAGAGGPKMSDRLAVARMFIKSQELREIKDPQRAQQLASMMALRFMQNPELPVPYIISTVMDEYEYGPSMPGGDEEE